MKKCELIAYFKYFYVDKDLINLIIFTTYQNIIYILPLPHGSLYSGFWYVWDHLTR